MTTPGPLTGWRVLVPRGGDWGARVAGLVTAQGGTATVVPLIGFRPAADPAPLAGALAGLRSGAHTWLVVTSATTVEHLAAAAHPVPLADAVGARVAAVGPGTAAALQRAGVGVDLVPSGERSARGLVAEFPPPPPGGARVLVPHSDIAETTVVDGLGALGWLVDAVVAYRTVPEGVPPDVAEAVRAGGFDAVLLSSASTVSALVDAAGRPPATTVVCCIGPRTAEAAAERGLPVDVVPAEASADHLVLALADHAERNPR